MKVKWLGHAAFLITSESGVRIITDPYTSNEQLKYGEIKENADIVTVSHGHGDHNNVASVKGNPVVVKDTQTVKGIKITEVPAYHDAAGGAQRGKNSIFCFALDGLRVCHLGDLGHPLDDAARAAIGGVDILMVPVGGNYTIDAARATEVYTRLNARIVIPMHFKNDRCPGFPVSGVDEFIKGKTNVTRLDVSEAEFKAGVLPESAQVIVLEPAL